MFMNKKLKALWQKFQDWRAARKEKKFLQEIADEVDAEDYKEETISPVAECEVYTDASRLTDFARRHIDHIETATYSPHYGPPIEFCEKTVYQDGSFDVVTIATQEDVYRGIQPVSKKRCTMHPDPVRAVIDKIEINTNIQKDVHGLPLDRSILRECGRADTHGDIKRE